MVNCDFRVEAVQERKTLDLYLLTRLIRVAFLGLGLFLVGGNTSHVRDAGVFPAWKKLRCISTPSERCAFSGHSTSIVKL